MYQSSRVVRLLRIADRSDSLFTATRSHSPSLFATATATTQQIRSFNRAARIPSITASQARKRPTLNSECQTATTFPSPVILTARTIFIQTQDTPNADALKFIPNHPVLPPEFPTSSLEYTSPRSTVAPPYPSPLAARLLGVDGVSSGPNRREMKLMAGQKPVECGCSAFKE